jgi:hypothetical protein
MLPKLPQRGGKGYCDFPFSQPSLLSNNECIPDQTSSECWIFWQGSRLGCKPRLSLIKLYFMSPWSGKTSWSVYPGMYPGVPHGEGSYQMLDQPL